MKHIIVTTLALLTCATIYAQPNYSVLDTLTSLPNRYYAPEWYTNCHAFLDSGNRYSSNTHNIMTNASQIIANEYSVDGSIEILGLMCLVAIDVDFDTTLMRNRVFDRVRETLYLMQGTYKFPLTGNLFPRQMYIVDSLRWDNAKPYVLHLPRFAGATADTDYFTFYAYEVFFDTPLVLDSVFYIAGTHRSNNMITIAGDNPPYTTVDRFENYPTYYETISETYDIDRICDICTTKGNRMFNNASGLNFTGGGENWYYQWRTWNYEADINMKQISGPLFAIVNFNTLVLNSSDPEAGTVSGDGSYPHLSTATATANPFPGHTFVQWSDGNTDNPRSIQMTSDTRLVAIFR